MLLDLEIGDVFDYVAITKPAPLPQLGPPRWHIVIAESGAESAIADRIQDELALHPYLPVIHRTRPAGRGRKREVEDPMFPGYILVPAPDHEEAWARLRAVRGVVDFLAFASGRPKQLPDAAIEAIRHRERLIDAKRQMRLAAEGVSEFTIGEQVWAEILPFRAMLAKIVEFDARGRCEVLLDMEVLGRKIWPIAPHLLQKIGT